MFQESVQLCVGLRSLNRSLGIEPNTEAEMCHTFLCQLLKSEAEKTLDLFLGMYFTVCGSKHHVPLN